MSEIAAIPIPDDATCQEASALSYLRLGQSRRIMICEVWQQPTKPGEAETLLGCVVTTTDALSMPFRYVPGLLVCVAATSRIPDLRSRQKRTEYIRKLIHRWKISRKNGG